MTQALLLKLHRWTCLVFGLPLLAIIATGLILSFEPLVQVSGITPQSVDAAKVAALVQRYDPDGKARGVAIDAAAQRLRLGGADALEIDLGSGEPAATKSALTAFFRWARANHERLIGQPWLVTTSTIAMLLLMVLGILMGLPRLRNSVAGWHKGAAWFTLPLILLSPLTGLCMAFGLTFQSGAPAPAGGRPMPLPDAVRIVAKSHDLAQVTSIAVRGGRMMARIFEGGELRAYAVGPDGVAALPRNWPRLIHEGNGLTMLTGSLNVVVSVVLLGLLTTGVWLWGRQKWRRARKRLGAPVLSARP